MSFNTELETGRDFAAGPGLAGGGVGRGLAGRPAGISVAFLKVRVGAKSVKYYWKKRRLITCT